MIKIQETSKFHQIVIITSLKGDESFTMEFLRKYQYFTSDFMDFAGASKGEAPQEDKIEIRSNKVQRQ
jgi:hypothetical protein